eukprot:scpid20424/ scgid0582/ 
MSLAVGLDVYEGMSLSDLELDHLIQYHVDLNELIHTLGPLAQCLHRSVILDIQKDLDVRCPCVCIAQHPFCELSVLHFSRVLGPHSRVIAPHSSRFIAPHSSRVIVPHSSRVIAPHSSLSLPASTHCNTMD